MTIDLGERLSEKELCPDELLDDQEEAFRRDISRLQARRSEFVSVACPACGHDDHLREFEKFTFNYVTCLGCGTLFMNPRPSPGVMADYYADSENYRYWARYIFPASEAARREKVYRPWLERVLDYCWHYGVPRGTLMEVGSGFGTFAALAYHDRAFARVICVEPTPEMAQACLERGLEVIEKRIEDIGREVPAPDVIVAFEVIEHLFDPRVVLAKCADLLKPGGLLVVSCPNGRGFDISLLRERALAVDAEHVNFFNPESLTALLKSLGFDLVQVSTPGRLDAEFVHLAIVKGEFAPDPFLKRVLGDEWERLGWPFQQFLAEHGLSSHMWLAALKPGGKDRPNLSRETKTP